MSLELRMTIAGLLFGLWPVAMNRTGLGAQTATMLYCLTAASIVVTWAIRDFDTTGANWWWMAFAGVCGGFGLVLFGEVMTAAPKERLAFLFVFMTVVQLATPVVVHLALTWSLTLKQGLGLALALVSAILLL